MRYRRFPLISAGSALVNTAGYVVPSLLFAHLYGPKVLGWFALVDRVLGIPAVLVGQAASQVYMGEAARLANTDPRALQRLFSQTLKGFLWIGALPCGLLLLLGPWVFAMVFGDEWREAGEFARLLALMHYVGFAVWPLMPTLNVLERQTSQTPLGCGSALTHIRRIVGCPLSAGYPKTSGRGVLSDNDDRVRRSRTVVGCRHSTANSRTWFQSDPAMMKAVLWRSSVILGMAGFVAAFSWGYTRFLTAQFDYFGFHMAWSSPALVVLAWTLSLVPSLWMPVTLTRPSQFLYWILYLVAYVPSIQVPVFRGVRPESETALLVATFAVGFALIGLVHCVPCLKPRFPFISARELSFVWILLFVGLSAYALSVYWTEIRFVSLLNIYDQRAISHSVGADPLALYAIMWLMTLVNPALMAGGLFRRRHLVFLLGAGGQLLLYGMIASKTAIFSVVSTHLRTSCFAARSSVSVQSWLGAQPWSWR